MSIRRRYRSRRYRRPRSWPTTTDGRFWWCHPTKGWRCTAIERQPKN